MNLVVLSGNLTADPEVRFTPKGQPVCEFTIAHNKKWKTESGEEREKVAFIGCIMWGARGEAFAKFHRKGSKALIRGELVQESWEDKTTGKKQRKTRVQAEEWEFAGPKPDDRGAESRYDRSVPKLPKDAPAPAAPESAQQPEEEDVPF